MAPLPRRVLIAVTGATAILHGEHKTGLWINEAMHPYNVFIEAGFEVDLSSETGKYHVDWMSEQPGSLEGADDKEWNDLNSGFRKKIDNMPKAENLDSSKVGSILSFTGVSLWLIKAKLTLDGYAVRLVFCERRPRRFD